MTLIDKLNKHKETIAVLRGTEEQGGKVYKFECVWQGEIKTNFASGRKQATHNAVEKLFKVVAYD